MDPTIIVALITAAGSISGAVFGVLAGHSLTKHRIGQLEHKVEELGTLIEKTIRLEGRVNELEHDIRDIKNGVIRK